MLALILAGGSGARLDLGEKPMVTIRGRPMIEFVIEAFRNGHYDPVVVLSDKTPYTRNWCRSRNIEHLVASGTGYSEDIAEAVSILEEHGPFFTSGADLPCITPVILREVESRYQESGKEACSVWVPLELFNQAGCSPSYTGIVHGVPSCPAGINILTGDIIDRQQDEIQLLIVNRRLAYNINTREQLAVVRSMLCDR
jgi:adenosylcobinamide-phosphate guanylyltransferase